MLAMVALTVFAGLLSYALVKTLELPVELVLLTTTLAALLQIWLTVNCSNLLDAERHEALEVVGRICKNQRTFNPDAPLSTLMKDLEELFKETLRKERKIVENAADVICIVSTEGIILRANAASMPVLGYAPEDLVGQKLAQYMLGESSDDKLNPLLGADESIQKIALESQFRRKDGSVIDLLWSAHWSATDNGLFCVAHDITERKRMEERLRTILESLPAGVCVLAPSGRIKFINKTAKQICSIKEEFEWTGSSESIFSPCPDPFSIEKFSACMLESNDPQVLSTKKQSIPVEISARTIDWKEEPACLVMFIDMSEKRAAEAAKQQFLAMQDEAKELRRKLMDMVVHDIRSPLALLLSTQDLLLKDVGGVLEAKVRSKLEICQEEVRRVIRLINDLLKISRHEATKLNLSLAEADIEQLINQATSSIQDLASEKSIELKSKTVSSKINVDSDRVLQVIFNLLSNAIKFSPPQKQITVSSEIGNGFVRITVADQGKGIPAGSETSIFLPYSQVSWKDSVEKGGTGLGLSICREIVESHGGSIGVTNNSDGGASFWFTLPLQ